MRKLLPFMWISFVYLGVALAEGHDPAPPPLTMASFVFEARHTLVHLLTFALEAWLVARAVNLTRARFWRALGGLVALGVGLGLGIEILQVSRRADYEFWGGVWDIATDGVGAALGYLITWGRGPVARDHAGREGKISSQPERTSEVP